MPGTPKETMAWVTEAEQSVKTTTDRLRAISAALEAGDENALRDIDVALDSLDETLKAGISAVESLELVDPEALGLGLGSNAALALTHIHPSADLPIPQAARERLSVVLHALDYVLSFGKSREDLLAKN